MSVQFEIKDRHGVYVVTIDDIDADLTAYKWKPTRKKTKGIYVERQVWANNKPRPIILHRVIMERVMGRPLLKTELIDHVDTNPLNNCRTNLRIATHSQNHANSHAYSTNKIGLKGVSKMRGRYRAAIMVNYKSIHLGVFDTPELAHEAYKQAAIKYFGEFARFE